MADVASADAQLTFPGAPIDSRTMKIQEKVERLYTEGDYGRARFIYEHELAPVGDKYAQYMVGFMYLTGRGVEADPVRASAWYRLAAERANSAFLPVRDQLIESLNDADKLRSDRLYVQLRREYSDAVILLALIREDLDRLRSSTGSRVGGGSGSVTIVDPRIGSSVSLAEFQRRTKLLIAERVEFLVSVVDASDYEPNPNNPDVEALQAQVTQYVETIEDRSLTGTVLVDQGLETTPADQPASNSGSTP